MQKIYVVNYKTFAAFKLENTRSGLSSMENLLDEESHMISTDYIDEFLNHKFRNWSSLLDKEMDE